MDAFDKIIEELERYKDQMEYAHRSSLAAVAEYAISVVKKYREDKE